MLICYFSVIGEIGDLFYQKVEWRCEQRFFSGRKTTLKAEKCTFIVDKGIEMTQHQQSESRA